jgi:hypothetical protein
MNREHFFFAGGDRMSSFHIFVTLIPLYFCREVHTKVITLRIFTLDKELINQGRLVMYKCI